jgi:hypothetical protein
MVPMVTSPRELDRVRALLDGAVAQLRSQEIACALPPLGMMVEVPAAALAIDLFEADFLSIGSNDLIQYVTASSRDAGTLAPLQDPLQPALLRLIHDVVRHADAHAHPGEPLRRHGERRELHTCAARHRPAQPFGGAGRARRVKGAIARHRTARPKRERSRERDRLARGADPSAVAEYKRILQQVLENRPAGPGCVLAEALGKNRSFISQIANPSYSVPIPAAHIERIFETATSSRREGAVPRGVPARASGIAHKAMPHSLGARDRGACARPARSRQEPQLDELMKEMRSGSCGIGGGK